MIQVEDLTFTYSGGSKPVLRTLSFEVTKGEIFGFLGPSGAGKSTTQKILIGLLRGYSGSVTVFGNSLATLGPDYYERIGVSFEFPNHFLKLTALENLTYFGRLYSGQLESPKNLLDLVGLEDVSASPVSHFSKGMKNRLSVARALIHRPELLFLDEPTAGLDPASARGIKDLLKTQRDAGRTVFLTTHDMTVADELCDRVAFIVDGRIAVIDKPHDLRVRHGRPRVRVEYSASRGTEFQEFPVEGLGNNGAFLALLRSNTVKTLHTLEATLEEVFLRVTGRGLA